MLLMELWQEHRAPGEPRGAVGVAVGVRDAARAARREGITDVRRGNDRVHRVIRVERNADLVQVIAALCAAGRFARLLHGGKEERDQDGDDGDDDQKLNERKAPDAANSAACGTVRKRKTGARHWASSRYSETVAFA